MKVWRCFVLAALIASPAYAEGDPTVRGTRLDPLKLDASSGFSITRYEAETGVYYRWRIESDGLEEYKLLAPDLFRESWVHQVVIEDKEVKPFGLYAIEFDDEGVIDVWFIPQRPGEYEFYVEGLAEFGFRGVFSVK